MVPSHLDLRFLQDSQAKVTLRFFAAGPASLVSNDMADIAAVEEIVEKQSNLTPQLHSGEQKPRVREVQCVDDF